MTSESLVISGRFCGPPKSGNGGYVCGRVATHMAGSVAVRLKAPPPLETELRIEVSESGTQLLHGSSVVAEARAAELDLTPPAAPSFVEAEEAAKSYAGFTRHVFPRCFVCGPQRAVGDGCESFGFGRIALNGRSPWIPDASLANGSDKIRTEFRWAALDCTSGFAVLPVPEGKAIVLGELCARIDGGVAPHEKCIVIGVAAAHRWAKALCRIDRVFKVGPSGGGWPRHLDRGSIKCVWRPVSLQPNDPFNADARHERGARGEVPFIR